MTTTTTRNPSRTARLAVAAAAALVATLGARADQGQEFSLDDGRMEWDLNWNLDGATVMANQFASETSVTIDTVRVSLSGASEGLAMRVFVYNDPNDDGDPADAQLVSEASGTVSDPPSVFQDVAIPAATVSGTFYVGVVIDTPAVVNVMAADRSNFIEDPDPKVGSPDLSWFGLLTNFDDPDPFVESGPLKLYENAGAGFIVGGYFLIRAIANDPAADADEAADAIRVGALASDQTNVGASSSEGGFSCDGSAGSDVWFVHRAGCNGTLNVSAPGNFATVLEVHAGTVPGTVLDCAADGSAGLAIPVSVGDDLLIRVGGAAGAQGDFTLDIDCEIVQPANDDCAGAQAIGSPGPGGTVTVLGTTEYGTLGADLATLGVDNLSQAACGEWTQMDAPGVWYQVMGTGRNLTATLCSPGTDWPAGSEYPSFYVGPRIAVFCNEEDVCLFPICIDGGESGGGCAQGGQDPSQLPSVTWCSAAGSEYYILIFGDESGVGDFELAISDDGLACGDAPNCVVDNSNCLFPETMVPGQTLPGDLCSAAAGPQPDDLCGHAEFTAARWFSTVGDGTTFTASLCFAAEYDTALAVYSGSCANLTCAAVTIPDLCFPNETVSWQTTFGEAYLIRVFADFGCGNFNLTLTSDGVDKTPYVCNAGGGAPANDCCDGPAAVTGNTALAFDNTNAGTDPIAPDPANPCGSANADAQIWNDMWYLVTPPQDGDMTVSICDGTAIVVDEDGQAPPDGIFDSKIAVYDVTAEAPGDCSEAAVLSNVIGCNEDCPADPTSEITVPVLASGTYLVRLGSFDSDQDGTDGERGTGTITFSFGGGPACLGDTNGDNIVNVDDLVNVILDWGTDGSANGGDTDGSGFVNVDDLVTVILAWGPC